MCAPGTHSVSLLDGGGCQVRGVGRSTSPDDALAALFNTVAPVLCIVIYSRLVHP